MSGAGEFMQRLRMAAIQAVSEDDIREIFQALTAKAKRGDLAATKLLLSYLMGEPNRPQIAIINREGTHTKRIPHKVKAIEHRNGNQD